MRRSLPLGLLQAFEVPVETAGQGLLQRSSQFSAADGQTRRELKSSAEHCRKTDLVRFKAIGMGMRTRPGTPRTAETRDKILNFVEEMCKELSFTKRQKFLMLPKAPFLSWFILHERLSEADALLRWKAAKNDSNVGREVLDGRLCLAVKQFKELENAETVRSGKRMIVVKQAVPPRDARRRLLSKDTNLGALADGFMGGVSRDGASATVSGGRGGLAKARGASDSSGEEVLRGRGRSVEVWLRA